MRTWRTPRVRSATKCILDFCLREAHTSRGCVIDGLCRGHRAQKARGATLAPLDDVRAGRASPWERLAIAAQKYCDAGDEREAGNARELLRCAAVRYAEHLRSAREKRKGKET